MSSCHRLGWLLASAAPVTLPTACSDGGGRSISVSGVTVLVPETTDAEVTALHAGRPEAVGRCLGFGEAVVVWLHGTEIVDEEPLCASTYSSTGPSRLATTPESAAVSFSTTRPTTSSLDLTTSAGSLSLPRAPYTRSSSRTERVPEPAARSRKVVTASALTRDPSVRTGAPQARHFVASGLRNYAASGSVQQPVSQSR